MRLILLGPPGSGKGTQAKLLAERLKVVHIGTGDILREAVRQGTAAGKMAAPYVVSGKLVPDSLVNEVITEQFRREDRPDCFVMDGYPRTLAQAAAFDQVLRQQFLDIEAVMLLLVRDDEIVRRLTGRLSCPKCKTTYHVLKNPPRVPGRCDNDGTELIQRPDDKEDVVRERLRVYRANTEELIPHYREQGQLREVDEEGSIEQVYANIQKALKG